MVINEMRLPVRELIEDYKEDAATGRVTAWGGKLDVRPEFQREFVYDGKQQSAVINTVMHGFPLNIMYFVDRKDGTYEVLDGQQRIISICRYVTNAAISASIPAATGGFNTVNFGNLDNVMPGGRNAFLDYELHVYICDGTEQEKLDWFQVINIAGAVLTKQEIRNALYHSAWLTDAKSAFSRANCNAKRHYGKYLKGDCIRQDYLETVFEWKAAHEGITGANAVERFMQVHGVQDKNANDLWSYVAAVFDWVEHLFGKKFDPSMKGVDWGLLYNAHNADMLDPAAIQQEVMDLLVNDEVQKKSGIYAYVLSARTKEDEKLLNPRQFDKNTALTVYNQQAHKCPYCQAQGIETEYDFREMHADHKIPWSKGGRTEISNCQMLCTAHNLQKGNK